MTELKHKLKYYLALARWFPTAIMTGIASGLVGTLFHLAIEFVTEFRFAHSWVIYLLPIGALPIIVVYKICCHLPRDMGTNFILQSVQTGVKVPLVLAPCIFFATVVTHFVGGSAGREGAALQLGGAIGHHVGKAMGISQDNDRMVTMCGMAGVFSALFGTPITAMLFSMEVVTVGELYLAAMLPCMLSSLIAFGISLVCGVAPVRFAIAAATSVSVVSVLQTVALAFGCALLSIVFCLAMKNARKWANKLLKNTYLRSTVVGCILLVLTLLVGRQTYNGAGMETVALAVSGGRVNWYDFLLKLLFTAITLSCAYKGGEIVPTFFVGATFGAVIGPLLGMESGLAAALGMVALFCGVVNCPVAPIILGVEVFGGQYFLLFAVACAVSFEFSGYLSLYSGQRFHFSKTELHEYIEDNYE